MRCRMTQPFDVHHLGTHSGGLAFLNHCSERFLDSARNDNELCRVRRVWQLLMLALLAGAGCDHASTSVADFAAQRERMVKEQIVMRGVVEERVLAAMRKVPREEFVPAEFRAESYTDRPLPIGYDQTISQPFIVAFMTEELRPKTTDRVLEIGTGSCYQAAILAELVAEVYSIEI